MSEVPLYRRLADEVQDLIEQGSLRVGQRLPSVRVTARQRQISIGTAMQAYVVLENRGYIEARPKSGYYVKKLPGSKVPIRAGSVLGPAARVAEKDLAEHMLDMYLDESYFPLGTAFPHPDVLPLKSLLAVASAVGRSDPGIFGRYSMGRAFQPFVQELSRRYLQAGTALSHEEFIVTSSCTEAIHLSIGTVTSPGDVVVVESPTYFGILRIVSSLGLRAVEVPVDEKKGLSLEALSVALDNNKVKAVIVTPNFHNPTGACMPNARKEQLYSILCDHDIVAIEDDIYGELHHGAIRPKPLKAWDREGRVMLCSSLSKSLSPGLCLGWVCAGRHHAKLEERKWSNDSIYAQKVAARFLQEGYDRQLRRMRSSFREQVASARNAVLRYFPRGTRVTDPAGGFVLWVEFPAYVDTLKLRADALAEKIITAPGRIFSIRHQFQNHLRINCGLPWTVAFERAIQTLG
ncbi:MAG TPA: PLP-dependent aminotransferase family protein, partial [Opitutaceae bacterium]